MQKVKSEPNIPSAEIVKGRLTVKGVERYMRACGHDDENVEMRKRLAKHHETHSQEVQGKVAYMCVAIGEHGDFQGFDVSIEDDVKLFTGPPIVAYHMALWHALDHAEQFLQSDAVGRYMDNCLEEFWEKERA